MVKRTPTSKAPGLKSPSVKKTQRFRLAYDGPSLATGGMDILELAPAMMAIGRLLQSANARANGGRATLTVGVYPLKEGSLILDLGLSTTLLDNVKLLVAGMTLAKGREIFNFVFGKDGLLEVIKKLRGAKATISKPDEKGHVTVSVVNSPGAKVFVVDAAVAALLRDEDARKAATEVVRPLKRAGIDTLTRIEGKVETTLATKADLPAFRSPEEPDFGDDTATTSSETETILVPRNHPMYRGPKWKVRFQGHPVDFYVSLSDDGWLKAHDNGEIDLRPGDGLRVKLQTRTSYNDRNDPAAEYSVPKVLGVERGIRGEQQSLGSDE